MAKERLITRRQQGDLGEASAIEWLTRQGLTVSIPFGHSPDYDLIAEGHGRLLRVQAKTSTQLQRTLEGERRWSVAISTNGGNQSWTGTTKRFDSSKVDALFVLVGDGRRWLIPAGTVEGTNAIRLGGAKYSEFEIDRSAGILKLVYGEERSSRIDHPDRGSAGVGEPGRTVNPVAMPEWVRIPPPPSKAVPRQRTSASTTISANHQITIPKAPFVAAGLEVGDRFVVSAEASGRLTVVRIGDR